MSLMRDVTWHLEMIEKPDPLDVLEVEFVRDLHLRSAAGDAEDDFIEQAIRTAYRMAERTTRRALAPQTLALVIDERFPCGDIILPRPPLLSVSSIAYVDSDGVEQELAGSPAEFQTSTPSGPQAVYGRIRPVYGAIWPTTRCVLDAVTVTYEAGYPEEEGTLSIPDEIVSGMLLVIGELYKQRSESVHVFNQNPAVIRARDLWIGYRVY